MFTSQMSKFFIVLLVLAVALVSASFIGRSTPPAADFSYDSVEQVRVSRSFASAPDLSSDEQIEHLRLQRAVGLSARDASYTQIEQVRLARGLTADRSYDNIEMIRLMR